MKPKLKAQWVRALRSGKYEQGEERLCDADNHYCCLGVLCDIAISGYWEFSKGYDAWLPPKPARKKKFESPAGHLSNEAYRKLGLKTAEWVELAELNDSGESFNQIADYIEKNL